MEAIKRALGPDSLQLALDAIREAPCFATVPAWELDNAYQRPTTLAEWDFETLTQPLDAKELGSRRSLAANRLLYNVYEQGSLFLHGAPIEGPTRASFDGFYDPGLVALTHLIRPALERTCFDFLDREIELGGPWTLQAFESYAGSILKEYEAGTSATCERIRRSANPREAAKLFLLQVAPDFLSEASQMARSMPGNYGPLHSEVMKIFIDEFGYGVHDTKHSTLFERCLESLGLSSRIHRYYYWYLPTSLGMASYFHYLTGNKPRWFEYVGALWWIEAVVPHFNRQFSRLLVDLFGEGKVDTAYFDEHVGIDLHHRRMVMHKLVRPVVAQYGEAALLDIVRGVEAARLWGELADGDFLEQVAFCDALHGGGVGAGDASPVAPGTSTEQPLGHFLEPQIADVDRLFTVEAGEVEVDGGYLTPRVLRAGARVRVPAGRLFGARVASATARLSLTPVR